MTKFEHDMKKIIVIIIAFPVLLIIVLFLMSIFRPDIMIVNDDLIGKSVMLIRGDTIIPKQNNPQKTIKGKYFNYHEGKEVETLFIPEEIIIVGPHVVDYKRNEQFLVIDRKHLDSVFGRYVRWEENLGYVGRENFPSDKKKQKEMLDNSNAHVYYIINQQTADVYGPLSFDQYLKKKNELGVPERLKLKCEKE